MSARMGSEPTRRFFLAAIAVAPSAGFVAANVVQYGLGVRGAADWMNPLFEQPRIGWLVTGIILAGPILCFLLAASRLLPVRLVRDGDAWEAHLRVRADIRALVLVGISAVVGGILAGTSSREPRLRTRHRRRLLTYPDVRLEGVVMTLKRDFFDEE